MRTALLLLLIFAGIAQANTSWTETFESGVGRFDQYEIDGDTAFTWNSATQSLDAAFVRRTRVDRRYALIPTVYDVRMGLCGFSTVISISGQVPGGESDPACGLFRFMNSPSSDAYGFVLVGAEIMRPREDARQFILRSGPRLAETFRWSTEHIPFEFSTPYFVDVVCDGPAQLATADFYLGKSRDGDHLGTLTVSSDSPIGFNAVGFADSYDQQRTAVTANIDDFSFFAQSIPVRGTALLGMLGLSVVGVGLRRWAC